MRRSKWIMPIDDRSIVTKKYDFETVLGDGNFAIVTKCRRIRDGKMFAIKEIDRRKVRGKEHYIENEVDILCRCRHPNIIRLAEAYQTPNAYFMVLELLEYGDLFDGIKASGHFPEPITAGVVRDVACALQYLHQYDVVHRDIKVRS